MLDLARGSIAVLQCTCTDGLTDRPVAQTRRPALSRPCHILDVGCGSGLSGQELSESGHVWIGCDISAAMLGVAREREVEGDLILSDMGQGMCFRPGSFDAVISVSALQWLCNADKRSHDPRKRLSAFFTTLYGCMARGARAALQFYPENPDQMELITS